MPEILSPVTLLLFWKHSCIIFSCILPREGQRSGAGQTFLDLGDLVLSLHVFCGGVVQVGGSVGLLFVVWASSNWRRPLDFTPFSITLHPHTISKALETKPTDFLRDTDETRKRSSFWSWSQLYNCKNRTLSFLSRKVKVFKLTQSIVFRQEVPLFFSSLHFQKATSHSQHISVKNGTFSFEA